MLQVTAEDTVTFVSERRASRQLFDFSAQALLPEDPNTRQRYTNALKPLWRKKEKEKKKCEQPTAKCSFTRGFETLALNPRRAEEERGACAGRERLSTDASRSPFEVESEEARRFCSS
ncbi:hypothetical protein AAFF_G00056800 [Aldrovandia affinis]|uniref:Uncharacterized protein n=1 Tax=Aldrovandia affinis TaxID=143900 RepID=A0AAD7WEL1_9TELE|nr:hypothetical protein AAFF_G00056800 [Aldrovandia affinis]